MYPELRGAVNCSPCPHEHPPDHRSGKRKRIHLIQDHVRGAEGARPVCGHRSAGIEALSRGAAHCDFVEHNKTAYGIVSKNVESARVKDKAALHRTEAAEFVSKAGRERYDVIFLDPPYGGVILEMLLKSDRNV